MHPPSRLLGVLLYSLAAGTVLGGCHIFAEKEEPPNPKSLLRTATSSPSSVAIEVLLVLVAPERLGQLNDVWLHADEQIIAADTRRELARNGFRAGVIGPSLPPGFAELLELDATPMAEESPWQSLPLDRRATQHRFRQLRPKTRVEIQASSVHEEVPLFVSTDDGLVGDSYALAQAIYALQWTPLPQGRIEVEVTPELHHGQPATRYTPGEGHDWRMQVAKSREVFEQLQIRAALSAGQMLVISGEPESSGRLGHFFHTLSAADGNEHKFVIIRLAQVPSTP